MTPDLSVLVTFHAVTRYVQRVLNVTLDAAVIAMVETGVRPWDRQRAVAEAHCEAAGLTLEQVRALIMCPAVAIASKMRASQVSTADFQAKLCNGVVTTIVEPHVRHGTRMKQRGRTEGRSEAHKYLRRLKRNRGLRA